MSQVPKEWGKEMSAEERKNIRMGYRDLAVLTQQTQDQIADVQTNAFVDTIHHQQGLYDNVHHPTEAQLDYQQGLRMGKLLLIQTKKINQNQLMVNTKDLIDTLSTRFSVGNNDDNVKEDENNEKMLLDWDALGDAFAPYWYTVPPMSFLSGVIQRHEDPEEQRNKEKKPRAIVRRKRMSYKPSGTETQANVIKEQKEEEQTETKKRVEKLRRQLKQITESTQEHEMNLFRFVTNPNSFSETVENLFDLAFLVKEGESQITVDDQSKEPVVSYVNPQDLKGKQKSETKYGQCIVKLDYATWRGIVNTYQISNSEITRDEHTQHTQSNRNNGATPMNTQSQLYECLTSDSE